MSADATSIENSGLPSGRLPKELFGVCLTYRIDTYPNWEKPGPGKSKTVAKERKKRHYFLSTKKSTQKRLLDRLTTYVDLAEHEVTELHGVIEWTEVQTVEVTE